ncbi:MAG: AsmA family protein [Methyloceanibacter sp.]
MNSFLLTLTAVLIVVLGALFAAPLFIDWNDYRPVFETQASKLLGRAVKVGGKVHLVLLPAPELRFDDVKVADQKGRFDQPLLEARSIEAYLNISALLGGGVEARKITISDPVLRLSLWEDGSGNWGDVGRPGEALPLVPKDVLLDEVSITGGRMELTRPGEPALVIDGVEGETSAASLSGPYKVSATYSYGGRRQELRFSTSASDADGKFRLKSALRDPDRNTTYLLEGDVTGLREKPAYAGALVARVAPSLPAGQAAEQLTANVEPKAKPSGDEALNPEDHLSAVELKGELKATPDHAELPSFELTIHAKGRSQMLKGKLALDFGAHPKAVGELSARWVDADALLAEAGQEAEVSAAGALSAVAEKLLAQAASVGDGALSMNIEQASIGGDLIGDIDLEMTSRDGAVSIHRLKAKLPGENRIEASGRLIRSERGPAFEGPIKLEGSKLRTLTRWAAGDREMSGQASVGAFSLSAKAAIGGGELKLDDASGELSGTKFSGAMHYHGGDRRVIDLNLDSDRLDLREVLGDNVAWRSWLPVSTVKRDGVSGPEPNLIASLRDDEDHVALRVGELLLPNIPPGKLDAKFTLAKDTLDVERLDFSAEGAIALNGKGHIERLSEAPAGQVDFVLQAATAEGLRVGSELLGVAEGVTKSKQLASLAPLDMHVGLTAVRDGNRTKASVAVKGKAGGANVSLIAKATGEPAKLADAEIDIDGTVDGDRPQVLLSLFVPGLTPERLALAGADQGKLTLKAHGVPAANVTWRAELSTVSLQASFDGQGSLKPAGVALAGQLSAKSNNAALALVLMGLDASPSASGVPLDLRAGLAKTGQGIDFQSISGQIAGEAVQGAAHFDASGEKTRFTLRVNVASVSLPSLLGSLVAWQRTPSTEEVLGAIGHDASQVWPARGFALQALEQAEGAIEVNAKKLALGAPFQVEDAVLVARVDREGLSITDLKGRLFGGSFAASGTLSPRGAGAQLKAHADLTSGKLDKLSQSLAGRVLAKGPFTLTFNLSGEGLSPTGLVAGLNGEGTLFLDPGVLQALSPEPLRRVAIDAARTKKIKVDKDQIAAQARSMRDKLTHGTYAYAAAELPFEVKNGTLKLKPAALVSKGAETTINGYVELASLRVDSEWVMRLSGSGSADVPPVSLVFAGPLSDAGAITPSFDTAPVETYLTMRRMQEDVERLETLDVSGGNQPPADAEPSAETPPEAKRSGDAKPLAETPVEPKRSSVAAPKSAPSTKAPPVAAATPPAPRAADLEPDRATQSVPPPPEPAPEQLPWRQNSDNPPQAQPEAAPAADSPEQPTPAAAVDDDVAAPAAPRAPSRTRRPPQTPQEPSDWKKGVGIFGGG